MWIDDWGGEYKTRKAAIKGVIKNHMTDDNLIEELKLNIKGKDLYKWIFNNKEIRERFFSYFSDEIEFAQTGFAEWCIRKEDE